jgi:hypothetical protein
MNQEKTETLLRFTGDWPVPPVLGVAALLALLMFFYYRRELRFQQGPARWVTALLRSLAVFILALALSGPVLRHVTTLRQLGRVVLAVDASASMSYADLDNSKPRGPISKPDTRFVRVEKALLDPAAPMLRKLAERHDVELFLLHGSKAERVWWHRDSGADVSGDLPAHLPGKPDANITNLDEPLRDALGPGAAGAALVLLTDGQHNAGGSPEGFASGLRDQGVPIFTVGYGGETPPADLALVNVVAPEAIFAGDRAEGSLILQDTLPADLQGLATISYQNTVLWRQAFTTTGRGERQIDFSFPVKGLTDFGEVKQTLRLLTIKAELTGPDASKDKILDNNSRVLALHLLTRKRRALILDGRARWETRYVKNHFDRDERWQVNAAFDDGLDGPDGEIQKAFPKKAEDMLNYDLVVLGDLRPGALTGDQQQMLTDFVEKRGGGLILVDGRRRHLRDWAATKAGPLLPVTWNEFGAPDAALAFSLSPDGQNADALRLSDSASANPAFWNKLPRVNWCASAKALPGATTLVTVSADGKREIPAIIWRRLGAGSVLWLGTDEIWRWRYEVADQHHQRFWMQLASWIAAPPFLVENDRISLGTDRLRYQEGDTAELRVRLRDRSGSIISDGRPVAHVLRNGLEIASLELENDPAHGGVFRATTGALPSGDYHITVSEGGAAANDVRLAFRVESRANQEWGQLNLNRVLLESMALRSGGRFLREADVSQLPDLLQTLDRQETRVKETLLWSSWWWFGAVMALITAEWLLRKRWRLV